MRQRLKYWIFQKGKDCRRCCLWCEYYDICSWDVKHGKTAQNEKTIDVLALEMARQNGKNKQATKLFMYVALKQKERRKREKL